MIFSDLKFNLARRKFRSFQGEANMPGKKLAIVLDTAEKVRVEGFMKLREDLKIDEEDFRMMVVTHECPENKEVLRFCGENVSWSGKIEKEEVLEVLKCQFDILLVFVEELNYPLKFIVDNCRAELKIGRKDNNSGRYDLTIASPSGEVNVFSEEVKKYLNSLKGNTL